MRRSRAWTPMREPVRMPRRNRSSTRACARVPPYAGVILRTAYAEDALRAAAADGVRQYVLIGAGFDSFALRRPAFARDLEIFEIDQPATQQLKLRRLEECGFKLPRSVHFIAADLGSEALASALSHSGFDARQRAFFSWLGVTMYLTRAANLATLRAVAGAAAAGSELVFTYLDERAFTSTSNRFLELRRRVAAAGEPFQSGFDPDDACPAAARHGLRAARGPRRARIARSARSRALTGLKAGGFSHIARARSTPRRDHRVTTKGIDL